MSAPKHIRDKLSLQTVNETVPLLHLRQLGIYSANIEANSHLYNIVELREIYQVLADRIIYLNEEKRLMK